MNDVKSLSHSTKRNLLQKFGMKPKLNQILSVVFMMDAPRAKRCYFREISPSTMVRMASS